MNLQSKKATSLTAIIYGEKGRKTTVFLLLLKSSTTD